MTYHDFLVSLLAGALAFVTVDYWRFRRLAEAAIEQALGDGQEALSRVGYCEERIYHVELPYRSRAGRN